MAVLRPTPGPPRCGRYGLLLLACAGLVALNAVVFLFSSWECCPAYMCRAGRSQGDWGTTRETERGREKLPVDRHACQTLRRTELSALSQARLCYLHAMHQTQVRLERDSKGVEEESEATSHLSLAPIVTTTTKCDLGQFERQVIPWLLWHVHSGVYHFAIYYDGSRLTIPPSVRVALETLPGIVTLVYTHGDSMIHLPVGDPMKIEDEELTPQGIVNGSALRRLTQEQAWKVDEQLLYELTAKAERLVGNHQHIAKQVINTNSAIGLARSRQYDWLFHIDTDELIVPEEGDVRTLLRDAMKHNLTAVHLSNLEAQPEAAHVREEFRDVTLFKNNPALAPNAAGYMEVAKRHFENANFFLTYANGKSGARLHTPGLQVASPHVFGTDKGNSTQLPWRSATAAESYVLHYPFCRFEELLHKAQRNNCPYLDGSDQEYKLNHTQVSLCFAMGEDSFDMKAFIAARTRSPDELMAFFLQHVVAQDAGFVRRQMEMVCLLPAEQLRLLTARMRVLGRIQAYCGRLACAQSLR